MNGMLLKEAAAAGFEAFLSVDKKLEFEQNLSRLPLAVVVIDAASNTLPALLPFAPFVLDLLKSRLDPCLHVVGTNGVVHRVTSPRRA